MFSSELKDGQAKDAGLALVLFFLLLENFANLHSLMLVAILTLVLTMTCPNIFGPWARIWFGLSHGLGTVVSKILLTMVFVFVVIPIGFLRKLSGADSMRLNLWKKGSDSVFVDRNHKFDKKDLEKPY